MKIFLTLFIFVFALNANAFSFTERMSMQNKPTMQTKTEQKSTLTAEDKALSEECPAPYENYSQLVQALLIIIALMTITIYLQSKKISLLTVKVKKAEAKK